MNQENIIPDLTFAQQKQAARPSGSTEHIYTTDVYQKIIN